MATTSSADYYLTVDGLDGGGTAIGYVGAFAVADFSFDIDALSSWTSGGGASVGKPNLAPLIIDLEPGTNLNGFIENITQGQLFPHVRLEGVISSENGLQTVYDLRLDGVFVTRVTDTNGVDHLELVYKAVSLTTTDQNSDGSLGTPQTIGWDVPTAKAITIPLDVAVAGTSGGAANSADYYLTVDGLDGGGTAIGYVGAFAVADFSFDIDALSSWTSGGGASVGKPNLAPLIIDLEPGTNLNGFIENITQGQLFPHVRLEGVISSENGLQTVYDLRLDGVFVTRVTDTNGVDHLELVYKAVSLTTTDQNSDGSLGTPQTIGWDVPTAKAITIPLDVAVAGTSGGAANSADYYLTVDGLDGGGTAIGYVGAFAVADFSFDIDALSSWTSGGGASVGKPNLAPLIIDLEPGTNLNGFIENITQGQLFPHVRLEGVISSENGLQTVYDLRLDGVFVTRVTDTNGVDHLELVYKAVSLTTTDQNSDGSLGTPQTIGWDVPTAKAITIPLDVAVAGTSGGAANSADYYLTVDGLDGGGTAIGYVGAFAVADFSFDIDALSSWTSGGGASVGKPNLAPLIIDLEPGTNLNGFIENITQGQLFPHVRLEGVISSENGLQTVYDLRLDGVFVTRVTDTNGVDHLELVYKAVSLTTTDQNSDGSLGTPQTIGWDVPTAKAITIPLDVAVAGTSGGAANSADYYLTVDGLDGGGTAIGYVGAFAVADFSFDIDALSSWTSGGGASVGKPNLAPLIIDLEPGTNLNGFIENITQGQLFPHVRLEGVISSENGLQTVYDLRLDGVFVTRVTDTNGVDHLELVYKAVSLTTTDQNSDGSLGTPQTIGWDVPTAKAITIPLDVAVAGTSGGAANSADYYLTVDGLDGGGTAIGYVGAFAVADFSFDIDALSSWTSGGGASVGKPNLAPLIIDLEPGTNLNGFIENITQGQLFPHVRLEGVISSENGLQTVYDLRLDGVFVTRVTDTNGVDHLELVYKAVSLTTTDQNSDGSLGTPQTIGWDVPTAKAITIPLDVAVAGTSNNAPVAQDDSYTINEDTTLALGILDNDTDTDGDHLSVTSASIVHGALGSVSVAGDGQSITYNPGTAYNYLAVGEHARVQVSYAISDGHSGTSSAVATITINGVNDAPTANPDSAAVNEDQNISGNVISGGVSGMGRDTDPDTSDALQVTAVNGNSGSIGYGISGNYGTLTLNADGSYKYSADADVLDTALANQHFSDSFSYTIADGHGGTSSATLSINITTLADGITLTGGNGKDNLNGGSGDDKLYGLNGEDTLAGNDGADTIYAGNGNDKIFGGQSIDTLYGEAGDDTIDGGAGNDLIIGGAGKDLLIGGAGNDTFIYTATSESKPGATNYDLIKDFTHGSDKFDFSAIAGLGAIQGSPLTSATGPVAAHSIAWFQDTAHNETVIYGNSSGSTETGGATNLEIHLIGIIPLSQSDFLL